MTWASRALLWALALAAGLALQAPDTRVQPPAGAGASCPPEIVELSANEPDQTWTCRGWSAADFIGGAEPADVLVRPVRPHEGAPCQNQHYYRGTIVGQNLVFAFAGGAATGTFPLDADQRDMAHIADPYVTDVELGTEVLDRRGLTCALDAAYHFSCPAAHAVDRFCITWLRRARPGAPG